MPDFTPNEMDALFREGAERHEFEYNPDAWALMEDKLDKSDRKRRFLWFLLGGTLAILSIVSLVYWNTATIESKEAVAEAKLEAIENAKISGEKALTNDVVDPSDNDLLSSTQSTATQPELSINQSTTNEYILSDSKESGDNIGAQNSFLSESTGNLVSNEIVSISSPSEDTNQFTSEEVEKDAESIALNTPTINENLRVLEKQEEVDKMLSEVEGIGGITFTQFERKEYTFPSLEVEAIEIENQNTFLKNRFALTLFANPEWSSVGLFKDSRAGYSFGTRLGYQFADKFEISLGVAFSRKIYKGGGEAYVMEGGWFNDIEPERMDAKCDVIEIPVAFTYYLNGFRNSGFFADLGINSYMLHSEWYGFEYDTALVIPDRYKDVNKEDENSHLIGVGRVAIGYQKVLSNKTTVQVAPYLQFPLTGIGAGQVNLYSSGVQLAVKFNTQ